MAARAAFLAALAPVAMVPRFLASRHLEHFTAFYFTALVAAAAAPRAPLMRVGAALGLFAGLLELARMIPAQHRIWGVLDWEADFGGILAALAPMTIALFRSRFKPRSRD